MVLPGGMKLPKSNWANAGAHVVLENTEHVATTRIVLIENIGATFDEHNERVVLGGTRACSCLDLENRVRHEETSEK